MQSLYPLFDSIRNQINLVRKVHFQIDQRISGEHLSKFLRFAFHDLDFPRARVSKCEQGRL